MKKLNILFIFNSYTYGGAEKYLIDLVSGITDKGHQVTVVCPSKGPLSSKFKKVKAKVVPANLGLVVGWHRELGTLNHLLFFLDLLLNPRFLQLYALVRRLHRKESIDLVHVQFIKEKLWGTIIANLLKIPVIWTVHAPLEPWMRKGVVRWVHLRQRKHYNRIIAVCEATRKNLISLGFDPNKVKTIHNGIHLEAFTPRFDKEEVKKELGFKPNDIVIGTIARPYFEKGMHILLQAAVEIAKEVPQSKFVVIGSSRHLPTFRKLADKLSISKNIHFLGYRDDIPKLLEAFDIFTLSSLNEGLPYTILEAMAAGKPVVATNVGGVNELVIHQETGLLIKPDSTELVEALKYLIKHPAVGKRMGQKGLHVTKENFSYSRMIEETVQFFEKVARTGISHD